MTTPTPTTTPTTTPNPAPGGSPGSTVGWTPTLHPRQISGSPNRHYAVLEPGAFSDPVPMVILLHGGGGNINTIANQFGVTSLPAPLPYVVVIPQGLDPVGSMPPDGVWNSGHSFTGAAHGADDVGFIDDLLVDVAAHAAGNGYRIDQSRTYVAGFSNGGMMAYRLAAERSEEFAAVGIVAASIGGEPDINDPGNVHVNHPAEHDAEPVAIYHIHGLLDDGMPYYGGASQGRTPRADLPTKAAMDIWVGHNGCDPVATIESDSEGVLRTWSDGDAGTEVKLLTMPGRGHSVPDGTLERFLAFFDQHSK